tara:strand:+ start:36 stop:740 length:705 start_codon:yes stop_codon:yes gene_type:complete
MNKNFPEHIAIIMDGNGRWAKEKSMERIDGHNKGVNTVKKITKYCTKLKIKHLTLYTFSNENWLRPKAEVSSLMNLFTKTLDRELKLILENNIRFRVIGDKKKLDFITRNKINEVESLTSENKGMGMNLAISYGGRQEIVSAVNNIISSGKTQIDEIEFEKYLYTKNIQHPNLLIRTGKEKRISNFLLWQTAYSEIYFSNSLWPDFSEEELDNIIEDFQNRERRYGKTSQQINK